MSQKLKSEKNNSGFITPAVISFMVAILIISMAVLNGISSNLFLVKTNAKRQQAFNIAEAGINYYLWHLAHNSTDFKDGQTTPATPDANLGYGPYAHDYYDANQKKLGTYTLWIKPQGNGSTIATVRSIGEIAGGGATRTIDAQIGASSFASYGLVSDSAFWFGNTESANGPVHSNQGIRMDGANNDTVSSANSTYVPPSNLGGNGSTSQPGVWCHTSVTTPVNCNTRSKANWTFPSTTVDFNQISTNLCNIKKAAFGADPATAALVATPAAQATACTQVPTTRTGAYLPQRSTSGTFTLSRGYLIELNTNGTYNLYTVNGETDTNSTYLTALTETLVASNITIPSPGVIFAEDNVWVRSNPTYAGRVNIGAGRLASASNNATISIADDIVYNTKDGSTAIGLVAEGDVLIAPYAAPASGNFTFEVNAAILSQSGNVRYPSHYRSNTTRCTRGWVGSNQIFNFYGSVGTRQSWTWSWFGSSCGDRVYSSSAGYYISGFLHNTTSYDYNMLYAPPPYYPITGGYSVLSFREVLTNP